MFGAHGQGLTRSGIYKIVRRHAADLDKPQIGWKVSPHTFRHSCAVHLLESGVEVNVIRGWLGHADLSTTNRYAQINTKKNRNWRHCARADRHPLSEADHRPPIWRSDHALLDWLASL